MSGHDLKVLQPYYAALDDGSKTFEVRKNDRAYQRGDLLHLWEYRDGGCYKKHDDPHQFADCPNFTGKVLNRYVSFVYSGDPRFTGIEPGHVVLALSTLPVDGPQ